MIKLKEQVQPNIICDLFPNFFFLKCNMLPPKLYRIFIMNTIIQDLEIMYFFNKVCKIYGYVIYIKLVADPCDTRN